MQQRLLHTLGGKLNFNHLIESRVLKRACGNPNSQCYYVPAGNIRSTHGDNVHMTMVCKNCGKREDIFLSRNQYNTQKKLIHKEIGDV